MNVIVPIHILSANKLRTQHWRTNARLANVQKDSTHWALVAALKTKPSLPCIVTLTRLGAGTLDDDNCSAGFKACRDSIARWLGIDDADERVRWRYAQEKCKRGKYAVRISFEEGRVWQLN